MNGISPAGGIMDVAAAGNSSVALNVLASTEALSANVAAKLFGSLGIGNNINASA
jgi:hypothetical protein